MTRKFRRSEAFFGRRKTKALSPRKQGLIDNLLPKLRVDIAQSTPLCLSDLFPHKPKTTVLEIGFGAGEHLIHQAQANPETGYIGVEPFINSMAKALRSIEVHGLTNIRLYNEDATELLDWLLPNSVDRIDLMYPDPWPKKRHWKRRFVNQKNLDRFARVLKLNGGFHFASDIDTYINWTLNHYHAHPSFEWQANGPQDWRDPFPGWVRTRYETKAIREGRTPCYLKFICMA